MAQMMCAGAQLTGSTLLAGPETLEPTGMAVRLAKVMAAFMALTHGPKRSKSVPSAQQEPDASSSLVWVPKTTLDVWFLEVATRVERTTCTNTCACTCAVRGSTRYRTNASLHQADAITDVMTSMPFYVYGLHRAVL